MNRQVRLIIGGLAFLAYVYVAGFSRGISGGNLTMAERRSHYEIYWENLTFCKTGKSFTGIINQCDLNSKTGQECLEFLIGKGYLAAVIEGEKTACIATAKAAECTALFSRLYKSVFDQISGFKL